MLPWVIQPSTQRVMCKPGWGPVCRDSTLRVVLHQHLYRFARHCTVVYCTDNGSGANAVAVACMQASMVDRAFVRYRNEAAAQVARGPGPLNLVAARPADVEQADDNDDVEDDVSHCVVYDLVNCSDGVLGSGYFAHHLPSPHRCLCPTCAAVV